MRRSKHFSPPLLLSCVLAAIAHLTPVDGGAQDRLSPPLTGGASVAATRSASDTQLQGQFSDLEIEPPTPTELGLSSAWGFDVEIPGVGFGRFTESGGVQLRIRRDIPEAWTCDVHISQLHNGRFAVVVEVVGVTGTPNVLDSSSAPGSQVRVISTSTRYTTTDLGRGWVRLVGDVERDLKLDRLQVAGSHGGSLKITFQSF